MTGRDAFKIWAPIGVNWSNWVRPVPFISMSDFLLTNPIENFTIPSIKYITEPLHHTALIIDLPEHDSITEGIALARMGFRPIPIYNGTNEQEGAMALVDNHTIENALLWGAGELANIQMTKNAPPAFLLDSNRTHRYKMKISIFDNSWDLYAQDIPSAAYFLDNGINKIIVRSTSMQKDLVRIFYGFQKKGITFFLSNGYEKTKKIILKKPHRE